MIQETLIKKYEPKKFQDFKINKTYIDMLKFMINMDNLNVLFVGNIGTGKTCLMEALIREYYNVDVLPDNNILYINNLKEQGIHYYRNEVKIFCQTPSEIPNKKKIIVLDEIDQINEQSQQVFRNCIDKYSHKIHFIASCINVQSVIDSLQSRLTIMIIKPLSKDYLVDIVRDICLKEKITITNNVIHFIVKICNNSIRLLLTYIEKFKLINKPISLYLADKICTNISYYDFDEYTKYCFINKNIVKAVSILKKIYSKGYSVLDILDNYFVYIKTTTIIDEKTKYDAIKIISNYIKIFYLYHEDSIELLFFTNKLLNI